MSVNIYIYILIKTPENTVCTSVLKCHSVQSVEFTTAKKHNPKIAKENLGLQ